MATMRIAERAELSPNRCAVCGNDMGPVIEWNVQAFELAGYDGRQMVEGILYVCLGNRQNPGCATQAFRAWGGGAPWDLEEIVNAAESRIFELEEALERIQRERDQAVSTQRPVVYVDELLARLQHGSAPELPEELEAPRDERYPYSADTPSPPPGFEPGEPAPPHPESRLAAPVGAFGLTGNGAREGAPGATVGY